MTTATLSLAGVAAGLRGQRQQHPAAGRDAHQGVAIGGPQPSPFDLLVGKTVGSRVLLTCRRSRHGGDPTKDSVAVVIDILGQNGTAKQESAS